jgi:hypothetical protein
MNEIDLIPEEYRRKRLFSNWLKRAAMVFGLVSVIMLGSFFGLKQGNAGLTEKIQNLKSQRALASENTLQFKQLSVQKDGLQQQLNLLAGLRSGSSAEQMFMTMDKALPGPQVWITRWNFRRAGSVVEQDTETVNTGYFIVVPNGQGNKKQEAWKIETRMVIQGQALDHVAMSEFVSNLTRQPEIENVRIVSTRLNQSQQIKLVDFSLEIIVSAGVGKA